MGISVIIPVSGFAEKNAISPQNPNVVSGSANFIKDSGRLTINQNSDKLMQIGVISIGKDNKVGQTARYHFDSPK